MTIVGRLDFPARRGIPLADGPIRRGRHEAPAIRAERDAEYLARVPSPLDDHRAGGSIPQTCRPSSPAVAMRVPSGLKTRSQVNPMSWAEVAVCLPESGSYTVNTQFLGSSPDHCQPRTVRADGRQIEVRFPEGLSAGFGLALRRPGGSRCLWSCLETVREPGYGPRFPVSAHEPQSVPRRQRGQSIKLVSGGKERAQEFVTLQVVKA